MATKYRRIFIMIDLGVLVHFMFLDGFQRQRYGGKSAVSLPIKQVKLLHEPSVLKNEVKKYTQVSVSEVFDSIHGDSLKDETGTNATIEEKYD